MSEERVLTQDSFTFVPDPDGERLRNAFSNILRENGVVDIAAESGAYEVIQEDILREIGRLALFSFYYENSKESGDMSYLILDDDLVASVWHDDKTETPFGKGKIRDPLSHMRHAFGNCPSCATKAYLGYNLGKSRLGELLPDQMNGIELPETESYAEDHSNSSCEECQQYMGEWIAQKVRENPDYLWAFGGSGLTHEIPMDYTIPGEFEEYDILELVTGSDPPAEIEVDDDFLAREDIETEDLGLDIESEFLFNCVVGTLLFVEFDFDDLELNCKCRLPFQMSQELDIVLTDYESQKMVIVETTAENEIDTGKLRNKHNVILQFQSIIEDLPNLDILYLYVTTGNYPEDLHTESATLNVQESLSELGFKMEMISRPEDINVDDIDPDLLYHQGSSHFEEKFGRVYDSLLDDCVNKVEEFV